MSLCFLISKKAVKKLCIMMILDGEKRKLKVRSLLKLLEKMVSKILMGKTEMRSEYKTQDLLLTIEP